MARTKNVDENTKARQEEYKKIDLIYMMNYIDNIKDKNEREEAKKWLKSIALVTKVNKNGEEKDAYDRVTAKKEFCKRYKPELLPKPKKPNPVDLLKNW